MVETTFEQSYSAMSRLAAVRAATIVNLHGLPADSRRDLEQEALLELWRRRAAYDAHRGSWRTFSERVVANRMASLVRRMHSERSGQFREDPLENILGLVAPNDGTELRADVSRVLAGVSPFDRGVAVSLVGHSAIETSERLEVSRATLYRAIGRLRVAFSAAGFARRRGRPPAACRSNCASRIEVPRQGAGA
jgi:DNA-directed RNA polymerase specialized sigma24 family protein